MDLKLLLKKLRRYLRFIRGLLLEKIPGKVLAALKAVFQLTLRISSLLIPVLVGLSLTIIIYTIGFQDFYQQHLQAYIAHRYIFTLLTILFTARFLILLPGIARWRSRIFNLLLVVLIFYLRDLSVDIPSLESGSGTLVTKKIFLFSGVLILFFTEFSYILAFIYRRGVNPALLFVGSFAAFIVIGGFLLLLPNATTGTIHPIDAFFTSASAVCVTGLLVVDTATAFTMTGKVIILMLIQVGGLGIMTFAGLISFMVTGSVSFRNQGQLRRGLQNICITFLQGVPEECLDDVGNLDAQKSENVKYHRKAHATQHDQQADDPVEFIVIAYPAVV